MSAALVETKKVVEAIVFSQDGSRVGVNLQGEDRINWLTTTGEKKELLNDLKNAREAVNNGASDSLPRIEITANSADPLVKDAGLSFEKDIGLATEAVHLKKEGSHDLAEKLLGASLKEEGLKATGEALILDMSKPEVTGKIIDREDLKVKAGSDGLTYLGKPVTEVIAGGGAPQIKVNGKTVTFDAVENRQALETSLNALENTQRPLPQLTAQSARKLDDGTPLFGTVPDRVDKSKLSSTNINPTSENLKQFKRMITGDSDLWLKPLGLDEKGNFVQRSLSDHVAKSFEAPVFPQPTSYASSGQSYTAPLPYSPSPPSSYAPAQPPRYQPSQQPIQPTVNSGKPSTLIGRIVAVFKKIFGMEESTSLQSSALRIATPVPASVTPPVPSAPAQQPAAQSQEKPAVTVKVQNTQIVIPNQPILSIPKGVGDMAASVLQTGLDKADNQRKASASNPQASIIPSKQQKHGLG